MWRKHKTYYRAAHCHFCEAKQSPEEIGTPSTFLSEILNYLVLKCYCWVAKLFPRSISQCVTDCFKKKLMTTGKKRKNNTHTHNNNISDSFNKSRLRNSGLDDEQLSHINKWHSATCKSTYVFEEIKDTFHLLFECL